MPLTQSTFTRTDTAIPLIVVPEDTCADWLASLDAPAQAWAETTGFA